VALRSGRRFAWTRESGSGSRTAKTPPEVVAKICDFGRKPPSRGCNHLEHLFPLESLHVSAVTIQKILNEHERGTSLQRWLPLEREHAESGLELSPEQIACIDKHNPTFRERHVESPVTSGAIRALSGF
jgi:hypothetical protein